MPKINSGSPAKPSTFGKYFLHGLIAKGGMAEVYRARPAFEPTLFAIKVMRPTLAREDRFVDMFNREAALAMLLDHKAIVRTLEVGKIQSQPYIAMEYLSGQDLTYLLRRSQERGQRFPIPIALYIATCILDGLRFAHRLTAPNGRHLNIVNRDVSPSNVRITYDGTVKLLDFGIAQALMKFTSEIGVLKGKYSYMSPEQIRGMPVDARTDVFSAGIVLHEMLTTEKLFTGDTEFALMERVRKAEVPPPSEYNRRIPPELDRIALKALARDVSTRYQSADEFHYDLEQVLATYGFDRKELRQFVRQLFRKEFVREQDNCETALYAEPEELNDDDDNPDTHRDSDSQNILRVAELARDSEAANVPEEAEPEATSKLQVADVQGEAEKTSRLQQSELHTDVERTSKLQRSEIGETEELESTSKMSTAALEDEAEGKTSRLNSASLLGGDDNATKADS